MSSPKNIQRDAHFLRLVTSERIGLSSTATSIGAATLAMNSDGSVHTDYATMRFEESETLTAGNLSAAGILIDPPKADRVPYRVKAYCADTSGNCVINLVVGYAPASPTGTNDAIDEYLLLPFASVYDNVFDDVVMIDSLGEADGNYGNAIAFGIAIYAKSGITTQNVWGTLSVQNLGVKPPTMQQAIA